MNKEEFEKMLGEEADAVRTNYASLVGDVREFINDIALYGAFMIEFIDKVPMVVDTMDAETLQAMLNDLFGLQFLIVQELAGHKLQQHHEYLFGDKLDISDFTDAGDMKTRVNRFIGKYNGRGCDGVLNAFKNLLDE